MKRRFYGKPLPAKRQVKAHLQLLSMIRDEKSREKITMNNNDKKILEDAVQWVQDDVRYKAPEQLTAELYIAYVEHLMKAIAQAISN